MKALEGKKSDEKKAEDIVLQKKDYCEKNAAEINL